MQFSALLVFVLAAVSVQAAPVKKAAAAAVTITATGATSVAAKPDGCAHITPAGQNAQNVCAKSVTASGFALTVTDLTTGAKSNCKITGTSGTCGTTGAGATVGAAAQAAPAKAAPASKAASSAVTITATGATSVAAKPDGCAHITPAGQNAQNVCAKSVTASGFALTVTDLTTGAKSNCKITGTSGTCGTTGAGATIGAAPAAASAAGAAKPAKKAGAKKAAAGGKATAGAAAASAVSITAPGVTSVAAKPDGCAQITPTGANAQNVCAKAITASGFQLTVTDLTTKAKTACKITGTSGTCGTSGAGATVAGAAKRDVEENVDVVDY